MLRDEYIEILRNEIKVLNDLVTEDHRGRICLYDNVAAQATLDDCQTIGELIAWMYNAAWDIKNVFMVVGQHNEKI